MNIRARLLRFTNCTRGNAAVEFGVTAPILVVALVLMIDIGIALTTRMEMDRNVRAGVQAAISHVSDPDAIRDMIRTSTGGLESVSLNVEKVCSCGGTATPCTNWCSVDEPPSVFVNITATQPYSGIMLSTSVLRSETHVQLR